MYVSLECFADCTVLACRAIAIFLSIANATFLLLHFLALQATASTESDVAIVELEWNARCNRREAALAAATSQSIQVSFFPTRWGAGLNDLNQGRRYYDCCMAPHNKQKPLDGFTRYCYRKIVLKIVINVTRLVTSVER